MPMPGHGSGGMSMSGEGGMSMGCGDTSCASSVEFMQENMVMHDGMAIEFTCDVEVDFVRGMIPHHAGAMVMCQIVQNNTATLDPFVASLCNDINTAQTSEINAMTQWLADRSIAATTSCANNPNPLHHMGMTMGCGNDTCASTIAFLHENMAMHAGMAIDFTCDAEIDFIRGMIPHHQGAVMMCQILRNVTSGDSSLMEWYDSVMPNADLPMVPPATTLDPFLDNLCLEIEAGQNQEINAMTQWLTTQGLPVAAPCPGGMSMTSCSADVDGDLVVAVEDILIVLASFGDAVATGDIDGNGIVDVSDVLDCLSAFGTSCPGSTPAPMPMPMPMPSPTPEPMPMPMPMPGGRRLQQSGMQAQYILRRVGSLLTKWLDYVL